MPLGLILNAAVCLNMVNNTHGKWKLSGIANRLVFFFILLLYIKHCVVIAKKENIILQM